MLRKGRCLVTIAVFILSAVLIVCHGNRAWAASSTSPATLPIVRPLTPGSIARSLFSGPEQAVAGHLASVAAMANTVDDKNLDTYGFIRGSFWRAPLLEPFNARIQESVFTMAYFYATNRLWNPYYQDPALLTRAQAALEYWLKLQFSDGSFPELNAGHHSLTAVGFGLQAMHYALALLEDMPAVDKDLLARADTAARRAAEWALNDKETWNNAWTHSNQVIGAMLGVALFLPRWNDAKLDSLFSSRMSQLGPMQSEAGFFYESRGPGHRYSVEVMSRDLSLLYELTKAPQILAMQEKYLNWLSYNFLYEPVSGGFAINTATDTRHQGWNYVTDISIGLNNLWSQTVPIACAFSPSAETVARRREQWYNGDWNGSQVLSYLPPEHLRSMFYPEHYPSDLEKQNAIASLPYIRSDRFAEYRVDAKVPQSYLFVRRPGYYAGMMFGSKVSAYQQVGLSFLWHPRIGTVLQSQNTNNTYTWSTAYGVGRKQADSLMQIVATLTQNGARVAAKSLGNSDFTLSYPLIGFGSKQLIFRDAGIEVIVQARGGFTERLPVVLGPHDTLSWLGSNEIPKFSSYPQEVITNGFGIQQGDAGFVVRFDKPVKASLSTTNITVGTRIVHMLSIEGGEKLTYQLELL